jgi:hypothetical protein
LGEELGDGLLAFLNSPLQAVYGREQGRETRRQHGHLTHHFADHRRMPEGPRSQPSQVLQARFRRFAAELLQLDFTEDHANLPASARQNGALPIHPQRGHGDSAFARRQAIQVKSSFAIRHVFWLV